MKKFKRTVFFILAIFLFVGFSQPLIASSDKININNASAEQLMTLHRIGEKIAGRIIQYRKAHPFKTIEEIMNVKGIGQKFFDVNKDLITVKDTE
jgi:competence protein ComEA